MQKLEHGLFHFVPIFQHPTSSLAIHVNNFFCRYCLVEVGGLAEPILRTEVAQGATPEWNVEAKTTLIQTDSLQRPGFENLFA